MESEIRGLLSDVASFLTSPGLKESALSKNAILEKKRILEDIEQLRAKYPGLSFRPVSVAPSEDIYEETDDPLPASPGPVSMRLASSSTSIPETNGNNGKITNPDKTKPPDDEIKPTAVIDIHKAAKSGNLKKKDKKKIMGTKKVYCVLCDGIFYYFDKSTSKKQIGAFYTKDYDSRSSAAAGKKESVFDVVKPGGTTYSFVASSSEDRDEWIDAINKKSKNTNNNYAGQQPEEIAYEDTGQQPEEIAYEETGVPAFDEEQLYEETENIAPPGKPTPPPPVIKSTPPPKTKTTPPKGGGKRPPAVAEVRKTVVRPLPPDPVPDDVYDDTAPEVVVGLPEDEIYDEGESTEPPPLPPPPLSTIPASLTLRVPKDSDSDRPDSVTSSTRPYPSLPLKKFSQGGTIDYSCLYYGVWDFASQRDDELAFKRGEVVQVISKGDDRHGWWVAKLNFNIGLVPKTYLTEAYELVVK